MGLRTALFLTVMSGTIIVSATTPRAQDRDLQPRLGIRPHHRHGRALARAVRRSRQGDHESALHELPPGIRTGRLQGNDQHPHSPPAVRGDNGAGVPGNTCSGCHMEQNTPITVGAHAPFESIPGHPRWGLAPIEMAWEGKSASQICQQIKDPARNGGRDLALLHEHIAHDDLVAWGWHPGPGRDPAPGTQERMGQLIQAWIDTGAQCP